MNKPVVTVVGAGLAGCEAAWLLANHGVFVNLIEQKPKKLSPAHKIPGFAELVCSNSLKAERADSAAGLLKLEMRKFGSVCMAAADSCRVSAGGAIAVDRDHFSDFITQKIRENENISVIEAEQTKIPNGICIIATGPLTEGDLFEDIRLKAGDYLSFFDAAAPIVTAESIDFSRAFFANRYGDGGGDYINCPFNKDEYTRFHTELVAAEIANLHSFDKVNVYEGCMPIEVLAKRGEDSIRFGPLKPVGLRDPGTGHRPWAVVQLRRENSAGTLFNMVGFQTNLKFPEQKRVFSMIPGLNNLEIVRYGVMHRNTFINSPKVLSAGGMLKQYKNIFFAGQITGVEGYMESASSGILTALNVLAHLKGHAAVILPKTTMIGSLHAYITDESVASFQPMGANFGILPPLPETIRDKRQRYGALSSRALKDLDTYISERIRINEDHC